MGSTLPKIKDAPGSLAAEQREKEREITEENQLILASTSFSCKTEALHSGSLIGSKASRELLSSAQWSSWRSFRNLHSMAKRRNRITYTPKSRRKSSGSDRNQSAPAPGIGLKEKVTKSKGANVSRSSSSKDPDPVPREEVIICK